MNLKNVGFWILTALVALPTLGTAIGYLSDAPMFVEAFEHLGYPAYFSKVLGVWKVLGALALLLPVAARIKEWAYAGFFFTFTGAVVSHLASGDSVGEAAPPAVFAVLLIASYLLRGAKTEQREPALQPVSAK